MSSLDESRIFVQAGKGGSGSSSLLRAKFNAFGGPDGGNGGNGGNVTAIANQNINTLLFFKHQRIFKAGNGGNGSSGNRHGKSGSNITIQVPVGTQITNAQTGQLIADLTEHNQTCLLAKGGKGGLGNTNYKTSTNQAPRKRGEGKEGEEASFILSVSSIGDVGLVGLPNSGKSSLLAATTAAKAKIANYPFTTINPQVGFVEVENFDGFIMVDTPGLTDNASTGAGMGRKFLKHVQRCKILIHVVEASSPNPIDDYRIINKELEAFSPELAKRRTYIALNKIDSITPAKLKKLISQFQEETTIPIYPISTKTGKGVKELMLAAFRQISKNKQEEKATATTPQPNDRTS